MKTTLLCLTFSIFLSCESDYKRPIDSQKNAFSIATTSDYFYSTDPMELVLYNRTPNAALIESCGGELLFLRDRNVDGIWKLWYHSDCTSQIEYKAIPAGTDYKESILVRKPGVYRYRFVVFFEGHANPDTVYSNSFTIE